ncbi:methyl-accepting chemotaxis protein [Crocosphaera watsonii]|uniref:Methyl-accepting chemotaxis protein n=1 Tax=Crocosphaera watsonii WH 0003 TaxID=423471 RepID=G5JBC4_CROWT|nr:HAMP domain-containing methyl-accepting chemotaxis protein [Crocosphaera watsonii]EHJ10501.1 methyl-accepting chemotaxis protein [Crocosphaera watsonii WH 0003]
MTTHEKLLDAVSDNYSQESKEIFASPQEETPINTQGGGTLRRRLLTTILPTVLLPLAVASTIGINVINSETKSQTLKGVEKTIVITSVLTKNFLDDALNVKELLLASPFVSQNLQAGNKKVEELGLLEKSIEQVEAEFAETKLLNPNPDLNNYLQVIAKKNGLSEIILTEGNGFNVGYNVPSSDFVQSDEKWWQIAAKQGATIIEAKFDESTQTHILELVNSLEDSQTGELLGITKIGVSMKTFNENLGISVGQNLLSSQSLQIINGEDGSILDNFSAEGTTNAEEIVGGATVGQIVQQFSEALNRNDNVTQESMAPFLAALEKQQGITDVMFEAQQTDAKEADLVAERNLLCFEFQGRHFLLTRIPNTKFVVVSSVTKAEIAAKGRKLGTIFGITALILGGVATGIIILLAQRLSDPLAKLLGKVQQVAAGDLDVKAPLEGTQETRILGDSFNNLVTKVKALVEEQITVAQEKQEEKEKLELEIYKLLEEIHDSVDGGLTVRASLTSMEMSTVADLFNAIIDSLQDMAIQVKNSSARVSNALGEDQQSMQRLAQQAIKEAQATEKTLGSVEEMSESIQAVAKNANQAATLADDTYGVTQQGAKAMDETANSIVSLKTTIAETTEKMQQLEKSSQKISQVVSLIEEMTLKTNLLAINAGRSGEQGEGFAIFGEQLGLLAEQSAKATKEIANIVANIQRETQEVAHNMSLGSNQVNDTTQLVEATKGQLEQVLERSRSINDLMKSISEATISQTDTSQTVTRLMEEIAEYSKQRLTASETVSHSMEETAQVAQELEAAVEQFKVEK